MDQKRRKIFVGDTVKTPHGEGFVEVSLSWREKIEDMTDPEAREFSERCKLDVGLGYQDTWGEVLVNVKGRRHRYLAHQVEVVGGRLDV